MRESTTKSARYQELVNLVTALPITQLPEPIRRRIETEIQDIPGSFPTYSWRRCNFQAENQTAETSKNNPEKYRQNRELFKKNVEKLSHEFNLAGRFSEHWMKILVKEDKTITLRYWNPDDNIERTENYDEALKREDANELLDRGIKHATYPKREETFKQTLNNMAKDIYQAYTNNNETKQIYTIASPPPDINETNQIREGFGTHSFIYIFFCEWINAKECYLHIKQLRTELPKTAQIKMLNQYRTIYPIPIETKPEELIGYPTKLPQNQYETKEEYIEHIIYQPLVAENTESQAQEREKNYRNNVLSEKEIEQIHQKWQPLMQLYAELSLRSAPDAIKIQILNALEYYTKQAAIQKIQEESLQNNIEQTAHAIISWSKQGTFDCPIQNEKQTTQSTINHNNEHKEKKRIQVRCPLNKGGCGETIEIEEGTTICPRCGWDICNPKTTGKNKNNNTNTTKEQPKPKKTRQNEQKIQIFAKHHQQIIQIPPPKKPVEKRKTPTEKINNEQTKPNHEIIYDLTTKEYIIFFFGIPIRTKIKPKSIRN